MVSKYIEADFVVQTLTPARAIATNVFSACVTLLLDNASRESSYSNCRTEIDLGVAFLRRISHTPLANHGVKILEEIQTNQT